MSFSKEDRKNVFDFFESLLLSIDGGPIYYEHLRGHVSKASLNVQKYVRKECKGEKLLDYFRTRKNYFVVDRDNVRLRKKRLERISSEESLKPEDINEFDEEVCNDNEYSDLRSYTRSVSSVSSCQKTDDENQPVNSEFNEEMIEYEELTNRYFCDYLSRNEKLYLHNIEFNGLPKKVQRYLKKYRNKNVLNFFQSYPHQFLVDDHCVMLLTNPPVVNERCYEEVQKSDEIVQETKIEHSVPELKAEKQTVENFLQCVNFFVGILRKKGPITLEKLTGHLSQAPDILAYLQRNYKPFKLFFLDAPQVFFLNYPYEIYLCPDYGKLLKRAKKMSRLKSVNESLDAPVKNVIKSLFEMPLRIKRNSNSATCEIPEITDSNLSNQDFFIADNIEGNDNSSSFKIKCPKENIKVSELVSNCEPHSNQEIPVLSLQSSVSTQCKMQVNNSSAYVEINDHMHNKNTYLIDANKKLTDSTIKLISNVVASTDLHSNEFFEVDDRKTYLIDAEQNLEDSTIESVSVAASTNSHINECNKVDDRKNTSLIDAEQNLKKSTIESIPVVGSTDSNSNDSNEADDKLKAFEYLLEYMYTVHMVCFEMVEQVHHLVINHEYETVKFFVDILKNLNGKVCEVKNLQGILGQAPKQIIFFINQMYKGEKLKNFFQKQDEFVVNSQSLLVQLSSNYENILETRLKEQKTSIKTESYYYCLSNNFKVFSDVFKGLFEIINFLKNKQKTKLSRVYSFILKLPASFQDFINQIDCKQQLEKLRTFLAYFRIFIFHEDSVSLNREINIPSLVSVWEDLYKEFAENQYKKFNVSNCAYTTYLAKHYPHYNLSEDFDHVKREIFQRVEESLRDTSFINYSDLPNIFGSGVVYFLINSDFYARDIIWTLFASNLFHCDNGRISLKKPEVGNTFNRITCMYNTVLEDPIQSDETVSNMYNNIEDELSENQQFGNISCTEIKNQGIKFDSQNINDISLPPDNFVHVNEYANSEAADFKVIFESTNVDGTKDQSKVSNIYENIVQKEDEGKIVLSDSSNYVISDTEIINSENEVLTGNRAVINYCSTDIKEIVDTEKHCNELCYKDNTVELPQVNLSPKSTAQNDIIYKYEVSEQENNSSLSIAQALISPMDITDHTKLSCTKLDSDQIYDTGSFFNVSNHSEEDNDMKDLISEDEINDKFKLDTIDASLVQKSSEKIGKPAIILLKEDINMNETAMISNGRANTNDTDSVNFSFSSSETFDIYKFASDLENVELPQVNLPQNSTAQNDILYKYEVSEQENNSSLSISQALISPMDITDHTKLSCTKLDSDQIYDTGSFFNVSNHSEEDNDMKDLISEDEINDKFKLDTIDVSLVQKSSEKVGKPANILLKKDINVNETTMISNGRANTNDTDSVNCSFSSSETFDIYKFASDLENDSLSINNEIQNCTEKHFVPDSATAYFADPSGTVYIDSSEENFTSQNDNKCVTNFASYENLSFTNDGLENCDKKIYFSNSPKVYIVDLEGIVYMPDENSSVQNDNKCVTNFASYENLSYTNNRIENCDKKVYFPNSPKVYTVNSKGTVYIVLPEKDNIPEQHEDVFMKADMTNFDEEQSKLHTDSIDTSSQNHIVIKEDAKSGHFISENNFKPKKNEIVGTKVESILPSVINKPQSAETFTFNEGKYFELGKFPNEITKTVDNESTNKNESVFKMLSPSSSDSTAISKEIENDIGLPCIAEKDQLLNTEISETAISLSASSGESFVNDKCMDYSTNKRTGDMNIDSVTSTWVDIEQKQDSSTMNGTDQNFTSSFLQPLSAKIVLLAIDSCIAETVFKGKNKLLFCLKSSFHCDLHNDCLKCFDSLRVGDTVSCCLHPSDGESKFGTMCISLMFCKDSSVEEEKCSDSDTSKIKSLHKRYQSQSVKQENQDDFETCDSHIVKKIPYFGIDLNCSQIDLCQENLNTKIQQNSSMVDKKCQTKFITTSQNTQTACISSENGCQTNLSGQVKLQFPVVEKNCQASCSTASQITQTFSKSCVNECQTEVTGSIKTCLSVVENESQTTCLVLSQDTQTVYKSDEKECQTEVVKAVPCSLFSEKECQVNCSTISEHTQTVNHSSENECQTDISGRIKLYVGNSSLGCQTVLSGHVKKYPNLANKSCQSVSISTVDQISQTSSENTYQSISISSVDKTSQTSENTSQSVISPSLEQTSQTSSENILSTPESSQMCQAFNIPKLQTQSPVASGVESTDVGRESCFIIPESSKLLCDVSSQTIATGPIWIQKYCL